jgi:hypothetical protein
VKQNAEMQDSSGPQGRRGLGSRGRLSGRLRNRAFFVVRGFRAFSVALQGSVANDGKNPSKKDALARMTCIGRVMQASDQHLLRHL